MSHEFKVHHLTSQLLQLLQLQHLSPDSYNDTLLQHMTPYVTTQVSTHNAVRKITEYTSKKEEFLQRYSSLKIKHPRELDSLVYLLSKLVENQSLCEFIRARRPPPLPRVPVQVVDIEQINVPVGVNVPDLPPQDTKLTFKQLELLKDQLSTFTSKMEEADKKKKQQKETIRGDYPHVPSWAYKRFYLTSDYTFPSPHSKLLTHPLGTLSLHDQQLSIMDDLLHLMQGSNGRYIVANDLKEDHKRTFNIDRTLDVSLQSLLARMLPLCTHYSLVCRFIQEHSKFKHGTINQALAASMRGLIEEYLLVIAQLEYQLEIRELTLQKMWYYIQPCLHTMELLASIASTIKRARYSRGGRTLSLLHDITVALMGDTQRQRVAIFVTKSSCVPFFEMLSQWLLKGDFDDPYSEFMIEVNRDINVGSLHEEYNDYYWEGRYVGLQENIPTFLEMVAEKILQTGKYLNVVRTCGKKLEIYPIELKYDLNERYYTELIDGAYNHASKQVLDLIMRENDLIGHLDSIKHYFLFDQGDLFVHFMDIAESELQKPISFIPHSRLKSLMELALRTSVANNDRYKDNLRVLLEPYNLKTFLRHVISVQPEYVEHGVPPPAVTRPPSSTSLPGYDCLSLEYIVKWPLSLVLSRRCLTRYQLLFRHVFSCKYVEREITLAWKTNKNKLRIDKMTTSNGTISFALLQRMLSFIQGLLYYMTNEVIEPTYSQLKKHLKENVSTIDEVLARHTDFLDRCLKDCLLTNREVVELNDHLLQCCLGYATFMQGLNDFDDDALTTVKECETNFSRDLNALLGILNEMAKIESERLWNHVITRLDYNNFYNY